MRPLLDRLMAGLFALLPLSALADPVGFTVGFDTLYRIDVATGATTVVGPIGFADVEGLALAPDGSLYGVADAGLSSGSGASDLLLRINTATGAGTFVGALGLSGQGPSGNLDYGLAFTCDARLWLSSDTTTQLWEVSPATGAATVVGSTGQPMSGLAARGSELFGISIGATPSLFRIDRGTAAATAVGAINVGGVVDDAGLDFDTSGQLWATLDPEPAVVGASRVARIDPVSGQGVVTATSSVGLVGMEGLALAPTGGCGAIATATPREIPGPGLPMLALFGAIAAALGMRRIGMA